MGRCRGPGLWEDQAELEAETWEEIDEEVVQKDEVEQRDDDDESEEALRCSPVTVIYGHAAGRGLDIKPFSKGIDTGCVVSDDPRELKTNTDD
jgi:hypothetical protein